MLDRHLLWSDSLIILFWICSFLPFKLSSFGTRYLPTSLSGVSSVTWFLQSLGLIKGGTEAWAINCAIHLFITNFTHAFTLPVAYSQFLAGPGWICTCGVCKKSSRHNVIVMENCLATEFSVECVSSYNVKQKACFGRKYGNIQEASRKWSLFPTDY